MIVVVGDSYARGVGASSKSNAYPAMLGRLLDTRVRVVAAGGSGFTARGPKIGPVHKGPHTRRAPLVPARRDLLILHASPNDRLHPPERVAADMERFIARTRGDSPALVVGPVWARNRRELLPATADAARRVAEAHGWPFLDAGDWFAGTPDAYLIADGAHPNDAGHALIADRIAERVRALRQ